MKILRLVVVILIMGAGLALFAFGAWAAFAGGVDIRQPM